VPLTEFEEEEQFVETPAGGRRDRLLRNLQETLEGSRVD